MRKVIPYALAALFIYLFWFAASIALQSPALPNPNDAIMRFIALLPELLPHGLTSLYRISAAMIIGMAIAVPVGLLMGRSKKLDRILAPILFLTYPIPKVVFLPVLMVLLGLGDAPKIVLIAIVVIFQALVTSRDAAKAIPEKSIESIRSLNANPLQVAWHVIIPASLPSTFTTLRINTGTAIAILFLSESMAGTSGLGYYIVNAWGSLDYSAMFAGIIAMAFMGAAIYETINLLERRLTRWKKVS